MTSSSTNLTFPNGASKQIVGCGSTNTVSIDYKVDSSATNGQVITVTGDATGGRSGSDYTADTFTVTVQSPDSTAPTTTPSATVPNGTGTSPYNSGDWTNKNVTLSLSATDNQGGSGVKEIRYTTDGTEPTKTTGTVYTGSIAVSSTTTVKYLAVDNAGNAESPKTFQVNIDKTNPTVGTATAVKLNADGTSAGSYTAGTWSDKDVKVSWTCSDTGGSGAVKTSDSQTLSTETSTGSVTPSCADNATNTASGTAVSPIKIDKSAPTNIQFVGISNGDTFPYGSVPSVSCTADGAISGLASACQVTGYGTAVGPHTLTATATDNAGNTATRQISYTVEQAIAQVDLSNLTQTYDSSPKPVGVDTQPAGLEVDVTYDGNAQAPTDAGSYEVVATVDDANYRGSASGTLKIEQATADITVNGYSDVYDGQAHGATGSATGVNDEDLSAGLTLGSQFTDVPGGTANWSFEGGTNYKDASGTAEIVITQADATIVVQGFDGTYDGDAHGATTATATGVNNEDLSSLLHVSGSFTDYPGGTGSWNFDGNGNYNNDSGTFAVKIAKAQSTTTVTCGSGPFTYTGNAITPCSVDVSGAGGLHLTPNPDYANNVNAGTATATASYTFTGDANHFGSSDMKSFTIGKAQLSVNAKNQSTVYGDSNLAPSYELSGFVYGETATTAGVTGAPVCSISSSAGTNVGTYNGVISCTVGTLDAANYSFTSGTKGNLTITARPITVTADANGKTYGDSDPALTFQVGGRGLATNDTKASVFSGSLTRVAGETVLGGPYAINQGTLGANANYDLTSYTGANFTIAARSITVTADSLTKQIGTLDPALTYQATNLAPGDTKASVFSGSLTRDPGEGIGTYAIRQGTLSANSNYNLGTSFTNGKLTIVYGTTFSGVLQPINLGTQRSVFKLGSTIPVKFKLMDGTQPISGAVANLSVQKVDNTVDGAVNETTLTDTPTAGNSFRYDATGQQYILNLSTKNTYTNLNGQSVTFSTGTWVLTIKLDDGTTRTATIDIGR